DQDAEAFEWVADLGGAFGPAPHRRVANFLQHFQEESLLALEMTIEHRLRDAGGLGDLFGRGVLVAVLDEELFGVSKQLLFAVRLAKPRRRFGGRRLARVLSHERPVRWSSVRSRLSVVLMSPALSRKRRYQPTNCRNTVPLHAGTGRPCKSRSRLSPGIP